VEDLGVVDCRTSHRAEVVGVFDLDGGADASYPGSETVARTLPLRAHI
jgi:hypothetical protein